jgi:hypothetical protein
MAKGIGAAMAGGNPTMGREKDEFYPTPDECTHGLMLAEADDIKLHVNTIWEPACGTGDMSEVMKLYGFDVRSSDLIDRGYGEQGDFFAHVTNDDNVAIVTNPPFNLAPQFITHALEVVQVPYLALLLKSTFWHARRRYDLFQKHTPSVIYPMTWRPDFMKRGAPTMDCSWVVWDRNRPNTRYTLMLKPEHV